MTYPYGESPERIRSENGRKQVLPEAQEEACALMAANIIRRETCGHRRSQSNCPTCVDVVAARVAWMRAKEISQ